MAYMYLTTESGNFFSLSDLSFHIIMFKIPITKGHLKRLKLKTEIQCQTFIYKINTKDRHLNKTSAFDQ